MLKPDKPNFSYPTTEPFNFAGIDQDYSKAKVLILPVPYASTTYWSSGTKFGPHAIIEASRHMELYDWELQTDISRKVGIYTLPELAVSKNSPAETMDLIEGAVGEILNADMFPLMLGGEHSISFGAIQAMARKEEFSVLQLDAHTDLRDEFEGTRFHHGCVMRRVVDDLQLPLTQVGIRSVSKEEADFIKARQNSHIFFAPEIPLQEIIETLLPKVYVTFDLDVLDPSIMPSTGTPEPGGMDWYKALSILKSVGEQRRIIGADIVELSPQPGNVAPDFLAAKLAYKLIGYAHLDYLI